MVISKVIKRHGFSQEQVADAMGINIQSLRNTIGAGKNPTVNTLRSIAKFIGCSITEFFEDEVAVQAQQDPEPTTVCPHCGKPIHIDIIVSSSK